MTSPLRSVEECVLEANSQSESDFAVFRDAISANGSMKNKNRDEVLSFMKNNKTEWSMRVFDSGYQLNYPQYIINAIAK